MEPLNQHVHHPPSQTIAQALINRFTQHYEQFKLIPEAERLKYNQDIAKIPMQESNFDMKDSPPTYNHEIIVSQSPKIHITAHVWEPPKTPRGLLFFIHGLNGHAGNMAHYAQYISQKNNMVVIGHDCRNFGCSGGQDRGLVSGGDYLVTDAQRVIAWAFEKYGSNKKIFLSGLSMGGAISLNLAMRKKFPYAGVIFWCPAFHMSPVNRLPLTWKHYIQILLFHRTYLFPPSYSTGTRHKHFIQKIKADPYIYNGHMWAGTINSMRLFIPATRNLVKQFDLPYLFIQSGVDKVVDPFQIRDFERECQSKDKTHFFAKDAWHSICFDEDVYELVPQVSRWLESRL